MNPNDQNFNNDNQNYVVYNDEMDSTNEHQQSKFKRINDYIENHYHDSNSDDVDMDGNDGNNIIGKIIFFRFINSCDWIFSLDNNESVDEMDVDLSPMSNKSIKSGIDRMLELGRELSQMSVRLEKKYQNVNDETVAQNRKMMEVKGFLSLIMPWKCHA
jgi:hypothetical protein